MGCPNSAKAAWAFSRRVCNDFDPVVVADSDLTTNCRSLQASDRLLPGSTS
ncbi:MAG: hypothetical protein QNJ70_26455 [Xenococcaceae cyanobacterium MO_207.B15]|nr:hypothetical protein [Xenococcaceae cyanobacterium MO_207.B15]